MREIDQQRRAQLNDNAFIEKTRSESLREAAQNDGAASIPTKRKAAARIRTMSKIAAR